MASCWARKCENYVLIVLYFVLLVIVCHGIVLSPFEWWWATSTISRYSLTAYPMFIFSLFCEDVLQPFLKKWPEKMVGWWIITSGLPGLVNVTFRASTLPQFGAGKQPMMPRWMDLLGQHLAKNRGHNPTRDAHGATGIQFYLAICGVLFWTKKTWDHRECCWRWIFL